MRTLLIASLLAFFPAFTLAQTTSLSMPYTLILWSDRQESVTVTPIQFQNLQACLTAGQWLEKKTRFIHASCINMETGEVTIAK